MGNEPLLVVVGPTASGKTRLAVSLAEQVDGEVINADSVQIYKYFDIGSGKPTLQERRGVVHHLIDELDALEPIDAAQYAASAERHIADIRQRGKVPIICGGTFLWVRALLYGLAPAPAKDDTLRAQHRIIAEQQGRHVLHEQLRAVDPASAQRLSPNDFVRVSRALEVFQLTGKPFSELQSLHGFKNPRHTAVLLGIRHSAEALTQRIEARARHMLASGWVEEVKALRERGYGQARAMASVGYHEVNAALQAGKETAVEELIAAVVQKTRVFARRQRTWLRDQEVTWLAPEQSDDLSPLIPTLLKNPSRVLG